MTSFGYTLSSEEHGPRRCSPNARRAEELGFDFVSISDHYHPWVTAQGHSPFVWSVLGAIAAATERIEVGVGVTCPIMRIHPAVLAQAAATTSLLFDGRFFFGVGTGEALNEHILGHALAAPGGPPGDARGGRRGDARAVDRRHRRPPRRVLRGRERPLFDPPDADHPRHRLRLRHRGRRARRADRRRLLGQRARRASCVDAFEKAGGTGPRYAQLNLCWAEDEDERAKTVHEIWPNGGRRGPALAGPADVDPLRAGGGAAHRGAGRRSRSPCGPDIADELVEERARVRRRRLRPPLLPPDRPRPGRASSASGSPSSATRSRTRTNLRQQTAYIPTVDAGCAIRSRSSP